MYETIQQFTNPKIIHRATKKYRGDNSIEVGGYVEGIINAIHQFDIFPRGLMQCLWIIFQRPESEDRIAPTRATRKC